MSLDRVRETVKVFWLDQGTFNEYRNITPRGALVREYMRVGGAGCPNDPATYARLGGLVRRGSSGRTFSLGIPEDEFFQCVSVYIEEE